MSINRECVEFPFEVDFLAEYFISFLSELNFRTISKVKKSWSHFDDCLMAFPPGPFWVILNRLCHGWQITRKSTKIKEGQNVSLLGFWILILPKMRLKSAICSPWLKASKQIHMNFSPRSVSLKGFAFHCEMQIESFAFSPTFDSLDFLGKLWPFHVAAFFLDLPIRFPWFSRK